MECHATQAAQPAIWGEAVILVGNPNVGKSAIFSQLTGRYAEVSNYPGTTVEVIRGYIDLDGTRIPVFDTPGVNSLLPRSQDERVTRDILLDEPPRAVIQVGDAKNLRRTLLLAAQLIEMGVPLALALNMQDEAEARGIPAPAFLAHDQILSFGRRLVMTRELKPPQESSLCRRPYSIFGQRSMMTSRPAASARAAAAPLRTPSCIHSTRMPFSLASAMASSVIGPAASELRKTCTMSMRSGTSASEA